jgi:hypothetical protein
MLWYILNEGQTETNPRNGPAPKAAEKAPLRTALEEKTPSTPPNTTNANATLFGTHPK